MESEMQDGAIGEINEDAHTSHMKATLKDIEDEIAKAKMEKPERTTSRVPRPYYYSKLEPRIIAIGPYYRGERNLNATEHHKYLYVDSICKRNRTVKLEDYYKTLKEFEDEVRCFYTSVDASVDFVKMMLLDGCFIVEYYLRIMERKVDELNRSKETRQKLEYDMLLLHNQLPFSVLQRIFDRALGIGSSFSLPQIIIRNFIRSSIIEIKPLMHYDVVAPICNNNHGDSIYHLLHLFHSFLMSIGKFKMPNPVLHLPHFKGKEDGKQEASIPLSNIPSATELEEAGIKFKKTSGIFAVKFHRGTLEIPPLIVCTSTESFIKNLVLFEQLDTSIPPDFTSYVKFLDDIINTPADVALLRKSGIISHTLGSNAQVASLFNSIGGSNFFSLTPYMDSVYKDVDRYYKSKRHHWWASLMRSHFSSPWSFLKLVAAIIILQFTFIQTFFCVYSYYHPPGS